MKTFLIMTAFILSLPLAKADPSTITCKSALLNFDSLSYVEAVKLAEKPLEFLNRQHKHWSMKSITLSNPQDSNDALLKAIQCLNVAVAIQIELAELHKKETETKNP